MVIGRITESICDGAQKTASQRRHLDMNGTRASLVKAINDLTRGLPNFNKGITILWHFQLDLRVNSLRGPE